MSTWMSFVVAAGIGVAAGTARADAGGSPTCVRLEAEAEAEAALLVAPRLSVEGARVPGVAVLADPAAGAADGLQARAALALSPVDMLRGRAVTRIARARCALDRIGAEVERVLALGAHWGELAANRAELTYLETHIAEIDGLVVDAEDRLARQRATAIEVDELRRRRALLRRRMAELRHAAVLLAAAERDAPAAPDLAALADQVRVAARAVHQREADLRSLSAWRTEVRGGIAAADRAAWFAVIEVGYSFGQPWQRAAERRAGRARADELTLDARGAAVRLERLREILRDSATTLEAEIRALDDELAAVAATHARLAGVDGDAARHALARAALERVELESRRASMTTLLHRHREIAGETP